MASSDEEELVPQSVTNYYFVDLNDEPILFSVLPLLFDDNEKPGAAGEQIFLHGTGDGGLQKVYKQTTAWKLGLEDEQPHIMALTKDNRWIELLKPRKSYEETIRTILITVRALHFLKKKPESSEKSLCDHLCKTFSSFEDKPCVNDLVDHHPMIKLLIERDDALAQCQLLAMLLKEQPRKRSSDEDFQNCPGTKTSFIVDKDVEENMKDDDGDESDEEPDLFDSVCAICDNGGSLLCCEGSCMRCFHATRKDGADSECASLGFTRVQVQGLQNFMCKNCKYKQHQCFACGKLGSSDKSSGAEVFRCVNATCCHFYHPKCVADLLFKENEKEAAEFQKRIADGESFTCPVHKCHVCQQGENKEVNELQFAVCRRCPKTYHRKCLPRKIAFDDIEEEGIVQRAWDDLLPNRILIYCLKHKIDEDLGTPVRNHIKFPDIPERRPVAAAQKTKAKTLLKNKLASDTQDRTTVKPNEKLRTSENSRLGLKIRSTSEQKLDFQKELKPVKVTPEAKLQKSVRMDSKRPSKEKANSAGRSASSPSAANDTVSPYPKIDADTENRMIVLMEGISPSLTLKDIAKKFTVPSTHAGSARNIDRTITHGKVEGSVEAVKAALRKLDTGGSVEDARAVCEPDILRQLIMWRNKLSVYLAPALHGMRYTSFGRHFTKVDKLMEIVDKLQWYVQNGDMVVDFCCGANDFSRLMKEKLDEAGKRCSYKNYDVIQPKNDFNFERRDWMTVQPRELPSGSQLIMGLNPPFGVKAALANKFIDHALSFKPKLLILIVPSETERLDRKRSPYDLVWEDCEKLAGKSFYLPGSVDVNDMQMEQWNNKAPPLYLWSRPDWTIKHKAIAVKQGHLSNGPQQQHPAENGTRAQKLDANLQKEEKTERSEKNESNAPKERVSEGRNKKEVLSEDRNKKTAEGSEKRRPQENQTNGSRKRRKVKKKEDDVSAAQKKGDELSDMSISPPDDGHIPSSQLTSGTIEVRPSEPGLEFEAAQVTRVGSVRNEDIDDIAKRYANASNGSFNSNDWSADRIDSREYAIQSPEERFSGYGSGDILNRNLYAGRPIDADARMQEATPYSYQGYPLGSSNSGLGHSAGYPSSPFGLSGPALGPSVMDRYTPRLDEMSYPRGPRDLGAAAPLQGDMRGMRAQPPPDSFALGGGHQQHPFPPRHNSGGWLP